MFGAGPSNRADRNSPIESNEASAVGYGKGQEIGVSYLAGAMEALMIEESLVEQAQVTRPEGVILRRNRLTQAPYCLGGRNGAWVPWLAHDSHKAVFRQCARSPSRLDLRTQPTSSRSMIDVIDVQEGEEHVDIQQSPTHSGSSSRNRSINSFDTA
jgi:hypothetical protein